MTVCDVAIVGGGPAASAAGLMLARAGVSCIVIDRGDDRGDKPGESLAPGARPLLQRLGVWDDLAGDGHLPCHGNRSAWGSDAVAEMPFIFSPYGHGWHLDRRRFEHRLIARATEAGVQRRTNTRVVSAERNGVWRLQCDDGSTVEAPYVLDATGRAGWFAHRAGARRVVDDVLVAAVAFLSTDGTPLRDSFTLVEAVEQGWWYTAVLPNARLAAMFVTDPAVVAPRYATSLDGWKALLDSAPRTRERIAGYVLTEPPRIVDAGSARLDTATGDGWLALGDAAMALDPLSSHGIASALATGIEAAAAITSGSNSRYVEVLDIMWNAYASMRRQMYAVEQRWPSSPFWRRRAEA
jgi:flavin-dependent dehydrogenase